MVILCRLLEKWRKELEETVKEMKERDRDERGTGVKQKKKIPLYSSCYKDSRPYPTESEYQFDAQVTWDTRHLRTIRPTAILLSLKIKRPILFITCHNETLPSSLVSRTDMPEQNGKGILKNQQNQKNLKQKCSSLFQLRQCIFTLDVLVHK